MDDPVAVVQAMWDADRDDRIDDLLATMHPDVTWCPMTRPGLSLYAGHEGIRKMREETRTTRGVVRIENDDIWLLPDGTVMSMGRAIDHDRRLDLIFEAHYTFREGLISKVESSGLSPGLI